MVAADPPRNTGLQQVFVEREHRQKRETTEIRGKTHRTKEHQNTSTCIMFQCNIYFVVNCTFVCQIHFQTCRQSFDDVTVGIETYL